MEDTALDMFEAVLNRFEQATSSNHQHRAEKEKAQGKLSDANVDLKRYRDERESWARLITACQGEVDHDTWVKIRKRANSAAQEVRDANELPDAEV